MSGIAASFGVPNAAMTEAMAETPFDLPRVQRAVKFLAADIEARSAMKEV